MGQSVGTRSCNHSDHGRGITLCGAHALGCLIIPFISPFYGTSACMAGQYGRHVGRTRRFELAYDMSRKINASNDGLISRSWPLSAMPFNRTLISCYKTASLTTADIGRWDHAYAIVSCATYIQLTRTAASCHLHAHTGPLCTLKCLKSTENTVL